MGDFNRGVNMTRRELIELAATLLILIADGKEYEAGLVLATLTESEMAKIAEILAS
jgi:hypothetical protein